MSKEPTPQFPLYAQDFLTGCIYLTNEEIGMYIKMLCKQWTDGSIPKKRVGFLLGLEWENVSNELKSKFHDDGESLINNRLESERDKRNNFKKKQQKNGKKGGRPRKNKNPKETQHITQKKPLDKDYDKDNDKYNDLDKEKKKIIFPFESENFEKQWGYWKSFKSKEFNFKYKSIQSEQGALKKLSNLAKGNEQKAIKIMHESISNGWKGFFEINEKKQNGFEATPEYFKGVYNSDLAKTWNQ